MALWGCGGRSGEGAYQCVAPANPGGGWDLACRLASRAFVESGLVPGNIQVVHLQGAGGGRAFGRGDIRGVAAPEAANNAAANGSMIPLLTLGIPGSGTTAVLLGALTALDVTPGPRRITRRPEIFRGLVASMYIGNLLLLVLNLPLVGVFARLLRLPRWALMPGVAVLSVTAVFAVNQSGLDPI